MLKHSPVFFTTGVLPLALALTSKLAFWLPATPPVALTCCPFFVSFVAVKLLTASTLVALLLWSTNLAPLETTCSTLRV